MPAAAKGSTDATLEGQDNPLAGSGGDGGPLTFDDGTIFGDAGHQPPTHRLGALFGGLVTIGLVVVTLVAAAILGSQEGLLVADRGQAKSTATPSVAPQASGGAVLLSATPLAPATPFPSWTPSPAASPASTATVPCPTPASWRTYVVQAGETLAEIAARYGVTELALLQLNCLPGTALTKGQVIYVPSPPTRTATPTSTTGCRIRTDWPLYTVQQGDTLYSIATRVGLSVYELKRANCLVSDQIWAGQQLRVPYLPWPTPSRTPTATRTPTVPTPTDTPIPPPSDTPIPRPSDTPGP